MLKLVNNQRVKIISALSYCMHMYTAILTLFWYLLLFFVKKNKILLFVKSKVIDFIKLKPIYINNEYFININKKSTGVTNLYKLTLMLIPSKLHESVKEKDLYIFKPLPTPKKDINLSNKMYIRASKCFSKTKYSFIRQECKNIVYLVLLINILSIGVFLNVYLKLNIIMFLPYTVLSYFILYNWNYFIALVVNVKTTYLLWNHYKSRRKFGNYIDSKFLC